MEQLREGITGFVRALPVAHRIGIIAALGVLGIAIAAFGVWVTTPDYSVLYSGLEGDEVGQVVDQLEADGVPYELEGGGTTVLVPREDLYDVRARLAGEGVAGQTSPEGYEVLEEQGLSVSEFRQQVDYQRALEGELSRTLSAMDGIDDANVHLVTPEDSVFTEREDPVEASVVLTTNRELADDRVDGVAYVVASAVEGLELEHITVADQTGAVLHTPGETGGVGSAGNRNLRQQQEFEQVLAGEVEGLLSQATGGSPASVVVRSDMNFDEQETETYIYDPESQVELREQLSEEVFTGTGLIPGGPVGVDGGPDAEGGESDYDRTDELREFGVDREIMRTESAPGGIEGLSVAIVMDDGTLTGAEVPPVAEVEELVGAALGLDAERGDEVAVSTVPIEEPEEEIAEEEGVDLFGIVPQILGGLVLLIVAIALFLMTRRRQVTVEEVEATETLELPEPQPAPEPALTAPARQPEELAPQGDHLKQEVTDLVSSQPEEIATLLRGWLADKSGDRA
ncbi:flagellar M-ring protein FliF [Egibacter rhizosphaerae]|uniref:Flagellar M-ring protein n=1 Tax=Egibacter rhizosphaerae TaxID=1670831 RepID=A0A411YIW0_9ACTN|nr:flagellar basal-body MS-ring/collar protein FliF [Egibacter rhizosphaerae]QBI21234.1 flagellar M-ring protein FliF [Egibacter rhizosphaerae]